MTHTILKLELLYGTNIIRMYYLSCLNISFQSAQTYMTITQEIKVIIILPVIERLLLTEQLGPQV